MKEKLIQKLEDCALILDKAQINETKFQLRLVEIRSDIENLKEDLINPREFAVYWLPNTYEPDCGYHGFDHFSENNGYEAGDIRVVDELEVSEQVFLDSILVVRTK